MMFSSHPDPSKCPSEKEHKKYEAESDEFQRNSSGPASFLQLHPLYASQFQATNHSSSRMKKNEKIRKRLGL